MLIARTHVPLSDPAAVIAKMCDHFSEGGAFITRDSGAWVTTFDFGAGTLSVEQDGIAMVAEADDMVEMYNLRWMLAEHLLEFAGEPEPQFAWHGDGSELLRPPYFRLMEVVAISDITPHMRRLTLKGEDLERFATDEDLHVRLYLPRQPNAVPEWPMVKPNGIPHHPSGEAASIARRYTIRSFNLENRTIDVDFVVHEDPGPGSAFAARAKVGDMIGMTGPGGSSIPVDRDWYLLAGDETALPAIARMLEFLPPEAEGVALLEVENADEEQPLATASGIEVRWLHRSAKDGNKVSLTDAVRGIHLPEKGTSTYLWAAGEFDDFKNIRAYARKECGLRKDQHLVVSYWRRGLMEADAGNALSPERE